MPADLKELANARADRLEAATDENDAGSVQSPNRVANTAGVACFP
jgi:hypothetical protein